MKSRIHNYLSKQEHIVSKKVILTLFILVFSVSASAKKIHEIIYQNDTKALQKYIDKKENLDEPIIMEDGEKLHIMEYAAYFNKIDCLKLIVAAKSKIKKFKHIISRSFVYALSEKRRTEVINYLYEFDPDLTVTVKELNNTNAIMWAIVNYNSDLYFMLKKKSDLTHIDAEGNNLYHKLAFGSYEVEIFNDLLSVEEIDMNLVNLFKKTPMNVSFQKNSFLIENFILEKAKFYDDKSAYRDAVISGDDYLLNYVIEKIDTNYNWTLITSYYTDVQVINYPLEMAVIYDCVYLAKIIINQMILDIQNAESIEIKIRKFDILHSIINGRYLEVDNRFFITNAALWTKDKYMFEFIIETMNQINKMNDSIFQSQLKKESISYSKLDYKIATHFYGEPYVDSLNTSNNIKVVSNRSYLSKNK